MAKIQLIPESGEFLLQTLPLLATRYFTFLRPSSFVLRPSSFVLRPSSFVLRSSSFVLRPSSFVHHAECEL
ncbi:MAG: hypothetical protein NT004_07990 [Bacteroidetes bacterium]|nr:hypothetical protein [Bacteroidota bacterium]